MVISAYVFFIASSMAAGSKQSFSRDSCLARTRPRYNHLNSLQGKFWISAINLFPC